jgi:hypothetical protein
MDGYMNGHMDKNKISPPEVLILIYTIFGGGSS